MTEYVNPYDPDDLDQRRERRQAERDYLDAKANGDPLASLWDNGRPRRTRGTLSPEMVAKIKARSASRKPYRRA